MLQRHRLRSNGPIDLALCCQPYSENRADREAFADGFLYRAVRFGESPVLLKVHNISANEVEAEVYPADNYPLPDKAFVAAGLRRKLSLDLDLPAFYKFADTFPYLKPIVRNHSGLRPMLKDTLLEALCLAIADQQVNVRFAAELKHRLLTDYGSRFELDGIPLWLFPPAKTLANLDEHALRVHQFTRSKSSYIVGLARTFIADPGWEMLAGDDTSIVSQLCNLRGVGKWTAEYGAMMGLGVKDTLPAADIALMRMVQIVMKMSKRPTEAEVRAVGQAWSPWQGLVTFYLWREEEFQLISRSTAETAHES